MKRLVFPLALVAALAAMATQPAPATAEPVVAQAPPPTIAVHTIAAPVVDVYLFEIHAAPTATATMHVTSGLNHPVTAPSAPPLRTRGSALVEPFVMRHALNTRGNLWRPSAAVLSTAYPAGLLLLR